MSNSLYDKGREGFLDGTFNWSSSTIKACLVGAGYTPDLAAHEFLSDIASDQIVATTTALAGKTETGGTADANNAALTAVSGAQCDYIVLYVDSGDPTTSRLVALIDTANGLPCIPNGGDITIAWDTGTYKIFKL